MEGQRKRYTSEEKVAILKEHLAGRKPVSEVCERHGIAVNMFYRWRVAVDPASGAVDVAIPRAELPPPPESPPAACVTNIVPSAYDPGVMVTNIVCTNGVRLTDSGYFRLADLADTDGDGVPDGDEAAQGSDPLDPADRDPRDTQAVAFSYGDPSGSHSEKYRLTVTPVSGDPRPAQTRLNRDYGEVESVSLVLIKGAKYTVSLDHIGTDPAFMTEYGFSNYDWELDIGSSQGCLVLDDPDQIVTTYIDWPNETFLAEGKHATLCLPKVEEPNGGYPGEANSFIWLSFGLAGNRFQVIPDPLNAEIFWYLDGVPSGPETKVRWFPFDYVNSRLHVGYGNSPQIEVTYESLLSAFDDFMPPNNGWFGQKSVTVAVSGNTCAVRPVWFFFSSIETRTDFAENVTAAWYHYWKAGGAVPALTLFEYDHNLGSGVAAKHHWDPISGDEYYITFSAAQGVWKSVYNVNPPASYTEEPYPGNEGKGIHSVAKYCAHEYWHGVVRRETRSVLLGGDGMLDSDGDGLSNVREAEINTDPNTKDTCNIAGYTAGGADYSSYASTGDQELYCRLKQDGVLGDESKDWAFPGMQAHVQP